MGLWRIIREKSHRRGICALTIVGFRRAGFFKIIQTEPVFGGGELKKGGGCFEMRLLEGALEIVAQGIGTVYFHTLS